MKRYCRLTGLLVSGIVASTAWAELPPLVPTETIPRPSFYGDFGRSLAVGGDRLLVGSPGGHPYLDCDDEVTANSGVVYVYERIDDEWMLLGHADWCGFHGVGRQLDISDDGSVFVVGNQTIGVQQTGSMGVYRIVDGEIVLEFFLSNWGFNFGNAVSIDPTGTVVATSHPSQVDGTIYIYRHVNGQWEQDQVIGISPPTSMFGRVLDVDVDRLVVRADGGDPRLWIYDYNGTNWVYSQTMEVSPWQQGPQPDPRVKLQGDTLVIGHSEISDEIFARGRIWIYERDPKTEQFELVFTDVGDHEHARLGSSLDLDGDTLIAGARGSNTYGEVYVYERPDGEWSLKTRVGTTVPPDVNQTGLGTSVALFGDAVLASSGVSGQDAVILQYEAPTELCNYFTDFEGDEIPDGLLTTGECSLEYVENGVLVAEQPQGCTDHAAFETELGKILVGDFDVSVEWEAESIPGVFCGAAVSIGIVALDVNRTVVAGNRIVQQCLPGGCIPGGIRAYNAWDHVSGGDWCQSSTVPTIDTGGRFRIAREGDTVFSSYWNNQTEEWVEYRVATVPTEPVTFRVYQNHPGAAMTIYFDNFSVSCTEPVPGDLNGDSVVDVDDLFILLAAWGECPSPDVCPADIDGDGMVNVDDLFILLANWG